jgi:predicted phosphohydrolase
MRVFAISDLHLSLAQPKPMDVFGPKWQDHVRKIEERWNRVVRHEDVVLVAGDLSWAMRLSQAKPDLQWLESLPGRKVLIRGNHDYWWSSLSKVQATAGPSITVIQNSAIQLEGVAVCGARLWSHPESGWPDCEGAGKQAHDNSLWRREMIRLGLSVGDMQRMTGRRVALVHFPPVGCGGEPTEAVRALEGAEVEVCVFGHMHGPDVPWTDNTFRGIRYLLVSCDVVDFTPRLVLE